MKKSMKKVMNLFINWLNRIRHVTKNDVMNVAPPPNTNSKECSLTFAFSSLTLCLLSLFLTGCALGKETPKPKVEPKVVVTKPNVKLPQTSISHPKTFPSQKLPQISAPVVIVMDPTNRQVLFEKNAHKRRAVASTQKLITAMVALDNAGDKTVTVPKAATLLEPSKLYLRTGASYPIKTLIKSLLIKSANDVAYTIAHGSAGSMDNFVKLMNAKAASLGMKNSHFKNASGLTLEGQYSTAYDIVTAASNAYQYPFIRECVSTKQMTFTHKDGRTKTLYNTNKLLSRVPYCTGMKTGTTRASGYCLVSSGALDNRIVIVGVFGAKSKDQLFKDSEALLRWGIER